MKKKLLCGLAALTLSFSAVAQTAPDFSVTDIEGNQINLYADILDQGIIAVVDVSATWCGPCWSLHESHVLEELHNIYGPEGSNQLRVIYYEGDPATTMEDLMGNTSGSQGDWLDGSSYQFVNESPLSLNLNIWAPLGFPTVNVIRPSDYEIVADPWNVYTLQGQIDVIESSTGITLGAVGVDEIITEQTATLFPNPANNVAQLNIDGFDQAATVRVFDILGSEVFSTLATGPTLDIDVAALNTGTYFVTVSDETHQITKRLSVVH